MKTKNVSFGLVVFGIAIAGGITQTGVAGAAPSCVSKTYSWTQEVRLLPWNPVHDTGIVIPPPAAGESVTVVESSYSANDRYPADGSQGTRVDAGQLHESFGISIGGAPFGGLSTDAPNGPAEGAPDDFYSGVVSGSFGTGATTGGEVILRHASLYGFTESPNSINAMSVQLVVERCVETAEPEIIPPAAETPAAIEPAAIEPAAPETATAVVLPPVETLTSAESSPPSEASVLGVLVRAPAQELPATGSSSGILVLAASVFALSGAGLLVVRRRSDTVAVD